jgi:hypothetical protein
MRVAALLLLPTLAAGLGVEFGAGHTTYLVVHRGKTLFSATAGLAAFVNGKWEQIAVKQVTAGEGTDRVLGRYTSTVIDGSANGVVVTLEARSFTNDVQFSYTFPDGASGTSLVEHANKTNAEVIVNWPAFTTESLPNRLSWAGSFVQANQGQDTYGGGPTGGPVVWYDASDSARSTTIIGSPLDNFKATSAGPKTAWDGKTPCVWCPGTPGTITSLPAGHSQAFHLHAGKGGVTATVGEWGSILQRAHATYNGTSTHKLKDVTLSHVGYQTDNGAYYVFCTAPPGADRNCSRSLLDTVALLREQRVPMGYVSYQGAGASSISATAQRAALAEWRGAARPGMHGEGTDAPWCINTWGVDLPDGDGSFPLPVKEFHKALGLPLQLYAPYFCPASEYFNGSIPAGRSKAWTPVKSSLKLPGCSYYGFQDIAPSESREFYDWFFAKGIDAGMASFEPDFMNQNYNCVPAFVESATAAREFQHGMVDAAFAKGVTVQWCYAAPTDVLASLEMPALTNFRVSMDFCYGESWNVGLSSLIVWAAGSAPSKDTLWTSTNGKFAVPGCPWTPDHEAPAVELHVVVALMTTGPVGISDGFNMTNATLISRTIAQNGLLLKPSKPLTSVDSMLDGYANAPKGHVCVRIYLSHLHLCSRTQTSVFV